ncbi:hypothetical protein EYF80_057238 [Liparis tanakae]|uniref:Uncharacterized protein n=1 Tax=Liparis tanakae TaxID=230148 RepID=A0A4Z2EVC5_9TELE|nr:hypothetical protein EYF80_057238 [Liparis tanakae]
MTSRGRRHNSEFIYDVLQTPLFISLTLGQSHSPQGWMGSIQCITFSLKFIKCFEPVIKIGTRGE